MDLISPALRNTPSANESCNMSAFSVATLLLALWACFVSEAGATRCDRMPPSGIRAIAKTSGSNGFSIVISGNPQKYVPNEVYTVTLKGTRTAQSVQKFIAFILVVEPEDITKEVNHKTVGTFTLYEDTLSKFSADCPHAVTETSTIYKSEINLRWTAPEQGSGCVLFKALLVEHPGAWYMDEGNLTKELCEEEQENLDEQPDVLDECSACDEAKYEVVFEGLWTRHSHPKDYPDNEWLTHFSDIIGASHSPDYAMWEYGGLASEGLQYIAEWGSTRHMETELKSQSENIRTIIKARGLWHPNVNGKTLAVFRVDRKHHLMSLVSMLGPSPDWIVGVSKLELCLQNGSWVGQRIFNLYPYDAGTDSGVTYMSPNMKTYPQERIRRITPSYPNNEKSPFYDPIGNSMKPVARLTVTRQRLYEKSCSDFELMRDLTDDVIDDSDSHRPECATTDWTSFTACSVTCGKGLRSRSRTFLMPAKAQMMNCAVMLLEREMCAASQAVCDDDDDEENGGFIDPLPRRCAVSPWSEWSECSVTCGKGIRARSRRYLDPAAQKYCTLSVRSTEICMADIPECIGETEVDRRCAVAQWSDWSPCTATCGKGTKFRTRQYLNSEGTEHCSLETMQKQPCAAEKLDCSVDPAEALEICMQDRNVGPCRGYFPRWFFDASKSMCLQFIYGGCRGNKNNFERYEDCNHMCQVLRDEGTDNRLPLPAVRSIPDHLEPIDCFVTEWSDWTTCSASCGKGRIERRRMIKMPAQNGGKECPKKLIQRKKCTATPCDYFTDTHFPAQPLATRMEALTYAVSDCVLDHWSGWLPCSKSCGSDGIQSRTRSEIQAASNGGRKCDHTLERRYCPQPSRCPT